MPKLTLHANFGLFGHSGRPQKDLEQRLLLREKAVTVHKIC